ncbi:MAG TPA: mannose-6-phosphate isomerase, class I, partial [Pseudonocardiaceae bacterium]|nr:mannose-6-phosphate isomerase, class I [Pseudonocardiaceae bacterium]
MELLRNVVRPYAWGSRTAIAELLGGPVPAPHPQAELWLGAHPADPSVLLHADGAQTSLLEALHADPDRHLGVHCARHWGKRLPFLLKVLAADEPLSLQAHPSAEQAAEGFAREEARGIPRGAPERNYPDASHKPELICALTELHALVGFRDPARTVELLAALDTPPLEPYRALLAATPDAAGLRTLFTTWITLPQSAVSALLPPTLEACVALLRRPGCPNSSGACGTPGGNIGDFRAVAREILALAEAHPGDVGVLAALLLNHVVLRPGEAIYMPAGNAHAYLRGVGVELMAASDNVLRGGLTPKHVDVEELLRVLRFEVLDDPVLPARPVTPGVVTWPVPVREFALYRIDLDGRPPVEVPASGP